MTKKEFSRVCLDAASTIERFGLKKKAFGTNSGPKCAIGAMRYSRNGSTSIPLSTGESDLVNTLFRAARPRSRRITVVDFNDAKRTRKHDVIEVLRDMAFQAVVE